MPYPFQTQQTKFSGLIDGANVSFGTEHPYWSGTVRVYLNGIKQWLGHDYYETLGSTEVEMVEPPEVGDHLVIDYVKLTLQEEP